MFDAIINKKGTLLVVHFSEIVDRDQTRQTVECVRQLIKNVQPSFTVITDLGRVTHMDFECTEDIGQIMDLCNTAKVARVFRVIPNEGVDIGWKILSHFHYDQEAVQINTYPTFYQAMKSYLNTET